MFERREGFLPSWPAPPAALSSLGGISHCSSGHSWEQKPLSLSPLHLFTLALYYLELDTRSTRGGYLRECPRQWFVRFVKELLRKPFWDLFWWSVKKSREILSAWKWFEVQSSCLGPSVIREAIYKVMEHFLCARRCAILSHLTLQMRESMIREVLSYMCCKHILIFVACSSASKCSLLMERNSCF